MLIDCEGCAVRGLACDDCVVTVLLGAPPARSGPGVELDNAEQAAIAVLADSGLVPPLRLLPSAGQEGHWQWVDHRSGAGSQERAVG